MKSRRQLWLTTVRKILMAHCFSTYGWNITLSSFGHPWRPLALPSSVVLRMGFPDAAREAARDGAWETLEEVDVRGFRSECERRGCGWRPLPSESSVSTDPLRDRDVRTGEGSS